MTEADAGVPPAVACAPGDYPFHLVFDEALALCEIGAGMSRIDAELRPGDRLVDHFTLLFPKAPLRWELFAELPEKTEYCLLHRRSGLELRGRTVFPQAGGRAVFLGSSWLTDPVELAEFGLHVDLVDAKPAVGDEDLLAALLEREARSEARRDQDRLRRLTCELSAIFQLSPDGFLAFDEAGIRSYVNPAFLRMSGISRDEFDGISEAAFEARFALLLDPAHPPQAAADGSEVIRLARPRPTVLRRSRREARDMDGRLFGRILYFRDITLETELIQANGEFLVNAAHELRTPMASIHGFTELLLRRELEPDKRREVLATMHSQSTRLIELINELLEVARFDARAARELVLVAQPAVAAVEQAVAELLVRDDPRRVACRLPKAADSPWVRIDRDRFVQALTNLLSNAYKYSPQGGEISVALRRQERGEEAWIGIAVRDRGMGMTAEEQTHLFERFFRAHPSGRIPGTGLGLSMVRKIMDLHEGDAEVTSAVGEGTEITLWLREQTRPA